MKTLLQIALICLAGSVPAQNLPLPARGANAPSGSEFARKISGLNLPQRDRAVEEAVLVGNIPDFLRHFCPVTVTNIFDGQTNIGTFHVMPDYLAVGPDSDYLLMPVSPNAAQRIADRLDCLLPTPKMVDAIDTAAVVKLAPSPIPPSAAMTTVPVFVRHNEMIRAQRGALTNLFPLGALVAGDKKDVVISARLSGVTNKVAIYGWHNTNGAPLQPLYLGHVAWWVDYSQCVRLVSRTMQVNGERRSVADVLADPKLCGLLSDEGVITNARYPTNIVEPPIAGQINLPWPQKFNATGTFGEWTREIRLPENVRILLDAPDLSQFSVNQPVLLIFYALPNGSTIEQTEGKNLKPGGDWHFDIQHIGAQTRWLRRVITHKAIVVAFLEAGDLSWPAWRKTHNDRQIAHLIDGVRGIFSSTKTEVVLASHSGGGSLVFGYLDAVPTIPNDIVRIAFLDSDYHYDSAAHAAKLENWLAASPANHLCVLAYQDYLARWDGKQFVSEKGGTWGRSRAMLADLQTRFKFNCHTNGGLEIYSNAGGQIDFLLKENPEGKILHTVQVERNGFIQAILSGTPDEGCGYQYLGDRVYTRWIQEWN